MSRSAFSNPDPIAADGRSRRKWFQFSLRNLLALIVGCAIAVTWWRHWRQSADLAAMRQELQLLRKEADFHRHVQRVFGSLDLSEPRHAKAFAMLRNMDPRWPLNSVEYKQLGESHGNLDVLIFHADSCDIPGVEESVVVLMRDYKLVDFILRESYTREEFHNVKVENLNDDGSLAVVFECRPGPWSDSEPFRVTHRITTAGFDEPR